MLGVSTTMCMIEDAMTCAASQAGGPQAVEMGASMAIKQNRYVSDFVEELKLEKSFANKVLALMTVLVSVYG